MATPSNLLPTDQALTLAQSWLTATSPSTGASTPAEDRTTARLAALVSDPAGLELAVRFVDRVARPADVHVAARELATLGAAARHATFLGPLDRAMLIAGSLVAPVLPGVVVPAARARLRQLVGHLVVDAGAGLGRHLAAQRTQGFRLNLNLLGEAVLGEREAHDRLARVQALVERPDVDHVSVKVSSVASQLVPWDLDGSAGRVVRRLLPLYRAARDHGTFLNLDMEEYKDLDLTLEVFERLMASDELAPAEMGVVLQAYLPDAHEALERVTAAATARVSRGGARVKVRLVKGANLAMERVDAQLHGWSQAPYPTKADVDAAYVRLVDRALRPEATRAVRVGVASHNLFHVALAHLLAEQRGVGEGLDVEMLQGMAPAQARAVRDTRADAGHTRGVVLYTPVVAQADFDVAIAYLVRRLEENAAGENFLHDLFAEGPQPRGGHRGVDRQRAAFLRSVEESAFVDTEPRRTHPPARPGPDVTEFRATPDSDPAVAEARTWGVGLLGRDVEVPPPVVVRSTEDVDGVVAHALTLAPTWAATSPSARAAVLRRAAELLEDARGDLLAVMAQEAGKTLAEADPEVSEAVDFARYYADRAEELEDGQVPGAVFRPHGLTVVTPPWNFPVAIPTGSVLAALAAGSVVLAKPAPQTPRSAALAYECVRRALAEHGRPADVLQVLDSPEGDVGRHLVSHPDVARVVLTGSIETARLFASWRPGLDVVAETSGKNALVVTPAADVDLAVADAVRSAFGHAGQKCSAASLLILVGRAGRSDRLRRQLADAVTSLRVGPATDPSTTMGPLVEPATGKLLRALTTLEPGEEWLVRPRRLDDEGRLWTPGVRHGARPGSFFHLTECFGPVLGVMRVETLDEAIALQNAPEFGLTGGLHSLDEDEIAHWLAHVQVGNAYVNRHITGAIVERQPFGGWKASSVGPGAKAGGPHYVAQLGRWADSPEVPSDDDDWLAWAREDDVRVWDRMSRPVDRTGLAVEENSLHHVPVDHLVLRVGDGAADRDVARVLHAARVVGVPVTESTVADASHEAFATAVSDGRVRGRVRVLGGAPGLRAAAAARVGKVTVLDAPVLASAERELLTLVREQAVSRTRHRYGHVAPGEDHTDGGPGARAVHPIGR